MMECKEFKQEIYLYSDLTASQKANLDTHIKQCTTCSELFEIVKAYQSLTGDVAEDTPQIKNHALLTSNIMQAVAQSVQKQTSAISFFESLFVKYALVVASFALTGLFMVEQFRPSNTLHKRMPVAQTVTLSSSSIAGIIQGQKEKKVSLYACIKSMDCNNSLVENFKQKKNIHEKL